MYTQPSQRVVYNEHIATGRTVVDDATQLCTSTAPQIIGPLDVTAHIHTRHRIGGKSEAPNAGWRKINQQGMSALLAT